MELLVTYIVALVVSVFAFAAMICWDLQKLQQYDFSSKKFYQYIEEEYEQVSIKRATVMVAFVGTLSFGQSWMVVALLSLLILGTTVGLVVKQKEHLFNFTKPISRRFVPELLLMLLITTCVAFIGNDLETKLRYALYAALLFTLFSYAFTIAVNWVMKPILNKKQK